MVSCVSLQPLAAGILQVALQLNDTHPSIAIPEVMRVLIDEELLNWQQAWDIVCKIFSFTAHTVAPEGLEKIPVDLLNNLLPRHLQVSSRGVLLYLCCVRSFSNLCGL